MIKSVNTRLVIVAITLVLAFLSLYPNMVQKDPATGEALLPEWWKKLKWLPNQRINLGLDLRGGVYLVYTVKLDEAIVLEGHRIIGSIDNDENKSKGIIVSSADVDAKGKISIAFADDKSFQEGGKILKDLEREWNIQKSGDNPMMLTLDMKPAAIKKYREDAIQQVRRTVASRIDKWGLAEASVQLKMPDQLIIELPGVEETTRIEKVINAQANLEFKLVLSQGMSKEAILQEKGGALSRYQDVLPVMDKGSGIINEYILVNKKPDITGDCISAARQGFGGDFGGQPVVFFNLKQSDDCAGKFARLTGANIEKRLAIVLDGDVMSAPVIRARIRDSGVIEGSFTVDSANDLSIVLKAGSLAVPVAKDRVESVGPSLGADYIMRGQLAVGVGAVLVMLFMGIYYKFMGLTANIAVILDVVFILAALATFGATLTLPGMAGIGLTIGMAVDANVLINERVREELRAGKTARTSVELGYARALSAIIDSNVTTLLSALVLYIYGTGPIKGFAVTLMFGLTFSVFTAVWVTRIIVDWQLERHPDAELSV